MMRLLELNARGEGRRIFVILTWLIQHGSDEIDAFDPKVSSKKRIHRENVMPYLKNKKNQILFQQNKIFSKGSV